MSWPCILLPFVLLPSALHATEALACQGEEDATCAAKRAVLQDALPADDISVELLQQRAVSKELEQATDRMQELKLKRQLATVTPPQPMHLSSKNIRLQFLSAVPTFGSVANYIALIHPYDQSLWDTLKDFKLYCSGPNNTHPAEMRIWGGGPQAHYPHIIVWHCDWPKEEANAGSYEVFIKEANGKQVGQLETSYDPQLLASYRTMACVAPVFYSPSSSQDPRPNSPRMLPQWLEYNLMHGVDHFLFYTFEDTAKEIMEVYRPYLDDGVATRVHLKIPEYINESSTGWTMNQGDDSRWNSGWTTNDCLYRTKNHAQWVLPTMDVDEFIRTDSGIKDIVDSMMKDHDYHAVHSLELERYRFLEPRGPHAVLISSDMREDVAGVDWMNRSLPKFLMNPSVVNTLFIHYATSWDGQAGLLQVPADRAVINHYRCNDKRNKRPTNVTDTRLVAEVPTLLKALQERFKMPWPTLRMKLARPKDLAPALRPQLHSRNHSLTFS
mmetsp:Transcript_53112/g.99554  ORF Transcript_53112/g.99554 Transcript_53112/m.99554 type:complete len:498 (-) Transcript_53112:48-1541(-)